MVGYFSSEPLVLLDHLKAYYVDAIDKNLFRILKIIFENSHEHRNLNENPTHCVLNDNDIETLCQYIDRVSGYSDYSLRLAAIVLFVAQTLLNTVFEKFERITHADIYNLFASRQMEKNFMKNYL